ncbi:MAG: hypothetical protein ACLTMD_05030 [Clostridium sp.]
MKDILQYDPVEDAGFQIIRLTQSTAKTRTRRSFISRESPSLLQYTQKREPEGTWRTWNRYHLHQPGVTLTRSMQTGVGGEVLAFVW